MIARAWNPGCKLISFTNESVSSITDIDYFSISTADIKINNYVGLCVYISLSSEAKILSEVWFEMFSVKWWISTLSLHVKQGWKCGALSEDRSLYSVLIFILRHIF